MNKLSRLKIRFAHFRKNDSSAAENTKNTQAGFSLLELLLAMTITLVLLGIVTVAFARSMSVREREAAKTDALAAAQAAINVMSREISNAGYGLEYNGVVVADSGRKKLHIRSNFNNSNDTTTDRAEDITYYYDESSQSVVRYDANTAPTTTGIINQVSDVEFAYYDYTDANSNPAISYAPTINTGRVRITLIVKLLNVNGQPTGQTVTFTSDITLRNSTYMLNNY